MSDARTDREVANEMAEAGVPPMKPDALAAMTATRSGLIHALLTVKRHRQLHSPDQAYGSIPAHHTRKRRDAQRIVDALAAIEAEIEEQQQGCARRLRVESLRKERPA